MAEYDARFEEQSEYTTIRFASDSDEDDPFRERATNLFSGYNGLSEPFIQIVNEVGGSVSVSGQDVKNLIKALEKAIEFGWTV